MLFRDTAKPDSVYREDMVLFVGSNSALFASYKKLQENKAMKDRMDNMNYNLSDAPLDVSDSPVTIPQEYLTFFDQQYFVACEYYARHYWYIDSLPMPNWEIHTDTQEIQGLSCFRAEATVAGRRWEVWFTPDFAVPTGPWLLRGLPGLIVEARDSKGEVSYILTGYEGATVENPILDAVRHFGEDYSSVHISNGNRRLYVTKAEYNKLPDQARKVGYGAYLQMQDQALFEQGLMGSSDVGVLNYNSWMSTIRNPIDLR